MSKLYHRLRKEIEYAKGSKMPRELLYQTHGRITMARHLEAISPAEYLVLEHECVAEGINCKKFFGEEGNRYENV